MIALVCALLSLAPQSGRSGPLIVTDPQPGVVVLGSACRVAITVEGDVRVRTPLIPDIAGARTQLSPPSTLSSQSVINGRVQRSQQVRWVLTILPAREGEFTVDPIQVAIDGVMHRSRPLRFEVVKEIIGQELAFVDVRASATRVYVHEPVRFLVDYGVDSSLQPQGSLNRQNEPVFDIELMAPWLAESDAGVMVADGASGGNVRLYLNGEEQLVEYTKNAEREGRRYHQFHLTKTFLPTKTGTFELVAPVLRYEVVTRRSSSVFDRDETRTLHAYGEPMQLEVLPLPEEGRPVPFYGAVGRFQMAADVDQRQVRVGSSLKLKLIIEGLGNTEFLRVPKLDDLDGFHVLGAVEARSQDRVVVTYDVTPLSADVEGVPAIHWNFFDTSPGVERYVERMTDPIPLQVLALEGGESLAPLPGEERSAVTPGVDDIFDMKPLADRPPAPRVGSPSRAAVLTWTAAPWLIGLLAALLVRRGRRRRADHAGVRARGAARGFRQALQAGPPLDALTAYLAARMGVAEAAVISPDLAARLERAGVDEELARRCASAVDRGVAQRYGGGEGLDAETAEALVRDLERGTRWRAPAGVVIVALCLSGALVGQGRLAEAEKAYRDGDYAAAARAYAALAEAADADPRLLYNLGNALYREGRLGEALVAYERARLALPRDRELLANVRLVRQKLELGSGEGEPFLDALVGLRRGFTRGELLAIAVLCHAAGAVLLILLRGRWGGLSRGAGVAAALLGVVLLAELAWWGPARAPRAIVTARRAVVLAEPREGLEPLMQLREGVEVALLADGPEWVRVGVEGRSGYVRAGLVGVVR